MSSYRHHIITCLQALLVLFAFASCVDKDDIASTMPDAFGDREYYLYLKFESASDWSQTRAASVKDSTEAETGDFVHGSEAEQIVDVSSSFIIFFDDEGNLFTNPVQDLADGGWDKENEDDYLTDDERAGEKEDKNYLEAGYTTRIYPHIDDEGKVTWPSQCLLVLNGPEADKLKQNIKDKKEGFTTKEGILGQIWNWDDKNPEKIGRTKEGYFTMTNSVYVDKEGNLCNAAIIDKEKHIKPIEELAEIKPEDMLRIRVERMAAKFTFTNEHRLDVDNPDKHYPEERKDLLFYPTIDHDLDPLIFFEGISGDGSIIYVATHHWRIRVMGWGINALETENHLFKQVDNLSNTKASGGYFDNWNDPLYYRSYWSKDPHYDDKDNTKDGKPLIYPWQYRDAVDRGSVSGFHYYNNTPYFNDTDPGYSSLKNYSYDYFVNQTYPKKEDSEEIIDNFNRVVYAPENTYGNLTQNLDSRINLLAGTHLIVCAQLEVNLNDDGETYVVQDWYRDRSGIFYKSERDCFVSFAHSFNQLLRSQESMKYPLYDWSHGGYKFDIKDWIAKPNKGDDVKGGMKYMLYNDGYYKVYFTDSFLAKLVDDKEKPQGYMTPEQFTTTFGQMKAANILYGDGKLLPWFEDANNNLLLKIKTCSVSENGTPVGGSDDLYIYEKDDDSKQASNGLVEEIVPGKERSAEYDGPNATDDDIKSLLYDWVGPVDHFNQGKMYYAAPVLHNGANKPEKDRSQKTLGDYGVVRNNWYQFNLKDIINIGTPVSAPDEPIVPNNVNIDDVINFTVKIIDWHSFQWDVPVLE